MKILVTGGAGFIASHIADKYIEAGHEVVIVDNLTTGSQKNINPLAKFHKLDIRSPKLSEVFNKEKFEIVNHHAAQINLRRSVKEPLYDADVNILGSINILENCVKFGVKKIIFASSGGAVYGEPKYLSVDEKHPVAPISPYAVSKFSVEKYIYSYLVNFGLKYTILRYGNVYGPRQDPRGEAGVIAIFIDKMRAGEIPTINGDGSQLRDYIYVADIADLNLIVLKKGSNDIYNVGTGKGTSVNSLYTELKKLLNFKKSAKYGPPITGEIYKMYLNANKVYKGLEWKANVDIKSGLRKTL